MPNIELVMSLAANRDAHRAQAVRLAETAEADCATSLALRELVEGDGSAEPPSLEVVLEASLIPSQPLSRSLFVVRHALRRPFCPNGRRCGTSTASKVGSSCFLRPASLPKGGSQG